MVLEFLTFLLLLLVVVLKYGAVTRIVRLNQRLREAENRCRKQEESLKLFQNERRVAEREESGLLQKQMTLEEELRRVDEELEALKRVNGDVLQELIEKKVPITMELLE